MNNGKLREAQDLLRAAAASNDKVVVPASLYNLGHARFKIGDQDLKKIQGGMQFQRLPQRATQSVTAAADSARAALTSNDMDAMLRAYRRGSGARKELKAATEAVKAAMEKFGAVLAVWERASADFRGAHEIQPSDTNSSFNASIVDHRIAALIDSMKKQEQSMAQAQQAGSELKDLMKQLRQRLPKDGPPSSGEEEDEEMDGDDPNPEGFGENAQAPISQEQAAQLLRGMQLDSHRTLPARPGSGAKQPPSRAGGTW